MTHIRTHILVLFFFLSLMASAQVGDHRHDFSVGVSGGCTLNKVSFSPSIKQNFKMSPQFGFATRYICEKYFNSICGVQVELNYQNLGWSDFFDEGVTHKFTCNQRFIELPLLMQMGWGKERRGMKFLFEAGPVLDFYMGRSTETVGEPWNDPVRPNKPTYQYEHDIDNKIAYGIAAGIGMEHSSAIGHFLLEARYLYGLGDMYDNSKKGKFGRSSNQTIEVKITYLFDILKTKLEK